MKLNENVPKNARGQFQQAQHRLICSDLQFSLPSVAPTKAIIAVEFALKTRGGNDRSCPACQGKSLPSLEKLLELALEQKWIDGFNPNLIE